MGLGGWMSSVFSRWVKQQRKLKNKGELKAGESKVVTGGR